jgi:UDP-2,3-diacylglucosamine pyrophosphatase LpxH
MSEESLFGLEKLPDDRSIIVVSDLHLGGREDPGTGERFNRFLKYLGTDFISVSDICRSENAKKTNEPARNKRLFPPEKIILLGDILELWDSRNQDRNCSFLDAFLPFLTMRDMDCDVIYVTGNHDEDVAEFIASRDDDRKRAREARAKKKKPADASNRPSTGTGSGQTVDSQRPAGSGSSFRLLHTKNNKGVEKAESLKVKWTGSRTLEICSRHYPAPRAQDGELGLDAGGTSYAFIHGQQFDREQVTYTISEAMGRRFDPVDFFQDLACISVTKKMKPVSHLLNLVFGVIMLWLFFTPDFSQVNAFIGLFSGIFLALMFCYGIYLFGYAERDRPSSSMLAVISAVLFIVDSAFLLYGWLFTPAVFYGYFYIPFIISLYILLVISIPALFAYLKRTVYNTISIKFKSPDKLIEEKLFDIRKFAYKSKVLVFGHTHMADFEADTKTDKVSLLVNTGSWVNEHADEDAGDYDTFVYIDKTGVCCLRWVDNEQRIECFCKAKGSPPVSVPLCEYIRNNKVKLKD